MTILGLETNEFNRSDSDLGPEPNCSWVRVWGRVGFGSRPGTNLQLGSGLGLSWIRIQAWDQSAVGPRSRSRFDSDLGQGLYLCDPYWVHVGVGPRVKTKCYSVLTWAQVHVGVGPRAKTKFGPDLGSGTCWSWAQGQDQMLFGPDLGPCTLRSVGHTTDIPETQVLCWSISRLFSIASDLHHHPFFSLQLFFFSFTSIHFFLDFIYVFPLFYARFQISMTLFLAFVIRQINFRLVLFMALKLHACVGVQLACLQYIYLAVCSQQLLPPATDNYTICYIWTNL